MRTPNEYETVISAPIRNHLGILATSHQTGESSVEVVGTLKCIASSLFLDIRGWYSRDYRIPRDCWGCKPGTFHRHWGGGRSPKR